MAKGGFTNRHADPEREAFYKAHPDVFVVPPNMGDREETIEAWNLYAHYVSELVQLDLLRDTEGAAKSGSMRQVSITPIGKLLLNAVKRSIDERVGV